MLGGFIGLALGGGPLGVIIGGLLGAFVGDALEVTKPVQSRISNLRSRGTPFHIHVDEKLVKKIH